MMTTTAATLEDLTYTFTEDVQIQAPLEATFAALLEQMGPQNETPDGTPLPMVIEPWPGGRWFRDLGGQNGHLWGFVQAIKRPTLVELTGPLFMSYPAVSNLQYRLTATDGGTLLRFRHSALGFIIDEHRQGLGPGWQPLLARIRRRAESR